MYVLVLRTSRPQLVDVRKRNGLRCRLGAGGGPWTATPTPYGDPLTAMGVVDSNMLVEHEFAP